MKRYSGAKGLATAAQDRIVEGRNDRKFVILHAETGFWLEVTDTSYMVVDGTRDDATGFDTLKEAKETATRLGLAGNGYVIRRPVR